jgi:hypothetical protein
MVTRAMTMIMTAFFNGLELSLHLSHTTTSLSHINLTWKLHSLLLTHSGVPDWLTSHVEPTWSLLQAYCRLSLPPVAHVGMGQTGWVMSWVLPCIHCFITTNNNARNEFKDDGANYHILCIHFLLVAWHFICPSPTFRARVQKWQASSMSISHILLWADWHHL